MERSGDRVWCRTPLQCYPLLLDCDRLRARLCFSHLWILCLHTRPWCWPDDQFVGGVNSGDKFKPVVLTLILMLLEFGGFNGWDFGQHLLSLEVPFPDVGWQTHACTLIFSFKVSASLTLACCPNGVICATHGISLFFWCIQHSVSSLKAGPFMIYISISHA